MYYKKEIYQLLNDSGIVFESMEHDPVYTMEEMDALGITAKGKDLKEARANAYEATKLIQFENKYMRNDIGKAIDEA